MRHFSVFTSGWVRARCLQTCVHDCLGEEGENKKEKWGQRWKEFSFCNKLRGLSFLNCYFYRLGLETALEWLILNTYNSIQFKINVES